LRYGKTCAINRTRFNDIDRIQNGRHRQISTAISLASVLFSILALKLVLFAIDPVPKFYMGDSGSYISTALTGAYHPIVPFFMATSFAAPLCGREV
jgi:hypothetical protein